MGAGLELLAEVGDVDAEILRLALRFFAPDDAEKLAMSDDLAGILDEDAQEGIFGRSELDLDPVEFHLANGEIDTERSGLKDGFTRFGEGTTLGDANACKQFGGVEWFGNVIVGAGIEGSDFVVRFVAHGKDQDGDIRPFAQMFQHFHPVHVRQPEIEQNDIRPAVGDLGKTGRAGFRFEDVMIGAFKGEAKKTTDLYFVVDNQGGSFRFHAFDQIVLGSRTGTGRMMVKRAPPPSRFSAVSVPPWASTKPRAIERPRPSPPGFRSSPR